MFMVTVFFLQLSKDLHYNDALRPTVGEDTPFPRVRMFSPMEMNFAFVLAAHRDIDDPQKMDDWKRLGLIHSPNSDPTFSSCDFSGTS